MHPKKSTMEKRAAQRWARHHKSARKQPPGVGMHKPFYFDMLGHKVGPPPANKSHKRYGWGQFTGATGGSLGWLPVNAKGQMQRPAVL
jgi:hypothetical protein